MSKVGKQKRNWVAPEHWARAIQLDTDMWAYRQRGGIALHREADDGGYEPRVYLINHATLRAYVAGLPKRRKVR